jgi:hypothetical protein
MSEKRLGELSNLRGSLSLLRNPGHFICEAFQRMLSSRRYLEIMLSP